MLSEEDGLTPLQDYVYQYEIEISGEDEAQEFLDDIKKLNTPKDVYDYYAYDRDWSGSMDDDLNNIFRQVSKKFKNLEEAAKDEEVNADVEAADDTTGEDTTAGEEAIDTTVDVSTTEVNPDVKSVQDALTQAQAAAQKLGDPKLTDQIGNTITFFTRSHVVEKPNSVAENLKESMFPMLKRILK
jgi:membrane-associated HD superfamily phosphohydrolase